MYTVSDAYEKTKWIGLRGAAKSAYYSAKFGQTPLSLLFHSEVETHLSPGTEFDIGGKFGVGLGDYSFVRHGGSKFSTGEEASVSHTGEDLARIGPSSIVSIDGDFSMGDSDVQGHSRIVCRNGITIGDGVAVSWNAEIMDDDEHELTIDGRRTKRTSPVEIRDDVWIGHDVSISKGVTVHEGSVVASDSVVLSDVPPNTLVAGSPAEVVRENVDSWE